MTWEGHETATTSPDEKKFTSAPKKTGKLWIVEFKYQSRTERPCIG